MELTGIPDADGIVSLLRDNGPWGIAVIAFLTAIYFFRKYDHVQTERVKENREMATVLQANTEALKALKTVVESKNARR